MLFSIPSEDSTRPIKKTLFHPKADEVLRETFKKTIERQEEKGKTIIYLDESGFAYDIPRTHGYSDKGKRCYGIRDWHAKGRRTVIGTIQHNQLLAVRLFDCNVDSDVFFA